MPDEPTDKTPDNWPHKWVHDLSTGEGQLVPMSADERAQHDRDQAAAADPTEGRKKVVVDGVEIDAPADMPIEEITNRHRELRESIERTRTAVETTDFAAASRAIADHMEATGWDADSVAFARAGAAATEIAALERSFGRSLTEQERFDVLSGELQKRLASEDG